MEVCRPVLHVRRGQVFTASNGFYGAPDQDAIHDHIVADREVLSRELMFGGYVGNQSVAFALEFYLLALIQVGQRNQDIVPGIEFQYVGLHL